MNDHREIYVSMGSLVQEWPAWYMRYSIPVAVAAVVCLILLLDWLATL